MLDRKWNEIQDETQNIDWAMNLKQRGRLVIKPNDLDKYRESVRVFLGSSRNKADAAMGLWYGPDDPRNVSSTLYDCDDPLTHNVALIRAATEALLQAKGDGYDNLIIFTNSKYLLGFVGQWVFRWLKNGWTKSDGEPAKNQRQWKALLHAMEGMNVKFYAVRDDSPSDLWHGMNEAWKLAKAALSAARWVRRHYPDSD